MPQMFKDMGVNISVLGNHEYDEGQESLARKWNDVDCKPKSWDITYIGANVRNAAGQLPEYVQPWAVVPVKISPLRHSTCLHRFAHQQHAVAGCSKTFERFVV